jgi:hypothetical protein
MDVINAKPDTGETFVNINAVKIAYQAAIKATGTVAVAFLDSGEKIVTKPACTTVHLQVV